VVACLVLALGCATMHAEETGALRVECNVPDAAVLLDDAIWGRVADVAGKAKSIPAGFYRVEIRHPRYYPYYGEINVAEGGTAVVRAELHPQLTN
jgi:hypothetical protein